MVAAVYKGQATSALDGKGRFSLPAQFRTVLTQTCDTANTLQLRADPNRPYLSLFGDQALREFQAEIERKADFAAGRGEDFDREQADADFFGGIEEASIDSGGRFSLPAKMKSFYGISDGLFMVGASRIIQLWAPERFLATPGANPMHLADCEQFLADLAARRGGKA